MNAHQRIPRLSNWKKSRVLYPFITYTGTSALKKMALSSQGILTYSKLSKSVTFFEKSQTIYHNRVDKRDVRGNLCFLVGYQIIKYKTPSESGTKEQKFPRPSRLSTRL